jgi:hypothetical protein
MVGGEEISSRIGGTRMLLPDGFRPIRHIEKGHINEVAETNLKHVRELSPHDFKRHPIWTWYLDDPDENLLEPHDLSESLSAAYTAYFIYCTFLLQDGTSLEGEINYNPRRNEVFGMGFYRGDEEFIFACLPRSYAVLEKFSDWLQKPIEAITPLQFVTPYFLSDCTPIKGEIDLRTFYFIPH